MSIRQFGGSDSLRYRDRAGGSLVIDNYINQEVGMKVHAKRGSAAAAVVALLLTTLGALVFPSTAGAAVSRAGGVTGIALNGTGGGDGLSYLGLYSMYDPDNGTRNATCIEWEGRAPDDEPGSYTFLENTDDPILSALAYYVDDLPPSWAANENILAAMAVVGKYRSSQLGLPGATSYPVGLPDPTGPDDFRLTNGIGVTPRTYNGGAVTDANTVAYWADFAWTAAENTGRDHSWSLVNETPHPGTDGGTINATWEIRNSAGALLPNQTYTVPAGTNTVGQAMQAGFGTPLPSNFQITDASGRAYVRYTVTDGTEPVGYGINSRGPSRARVLEPIDSRHQTMIVAGTPKVAEGQSLQAVPTGTARIGKVDGVSGDLVAGAQLRLTGPNGYDETFTSGTELIEVPDVLVGDYRLTETAAPPGYILKDPAPVAAGSLGRDEELTLTVDNYRKIDGATTASEMIVTSTGDTQIFDEITVNGVHAGQEIEVEAVFYAVEDRTTSPLTIDLAADFCEPANEIGRQTITVTGPGPHKVGPFVIPAGFRGTTTFQDRVIGDGPQSWLDACGQPDETTIVYPPIEGSTQALDTDPESDSEPGSEVVSEDGAQVWDRVEVNGLADGETAEVTAQLFADPSQEFPFENGFSPDACATENLLGEPITVTVTGTGSADYVDTITVGPFAIPAGAEGRVSFLDTVTGTVEGDRPTTRTWSDTCGNPAETLTVRKPVEAQTVVSETKIVSDDIHEVFDVVSTNLNDGETATLTANVYGYFDVDHEFADGNEDCEPGKLLSTSTQDVTGPGPHKVGPFRTDANAEGQITWQDGLAATVGEDARGWLDGCGTASETSMVRRPIEGSTQVTERRVVNDGTVELFDEITITGLRDGETATVTANVYGPYTERPTEDDCGEGELLESFTVEVTGPGPHLIGPYKVPADMFGFVTWQDGVQSADGRTWIDGCGRVTETTELVPPDEETPPTTTPPIPQQPPDLTTQRVNNPASPPLIPKAPASPGSPSTPPSASVPPSLAVTGAGVSVLALIGLGLVSGGLVLVRRRRRSSSGEVPA
jgi:LPXTG-motif cell wall-anchored protein